MRQFTKDKLIVKIFETRAEMGEAAAEAMCSEIQGLLKTKEWVKIILASAPSKNKFLTSLKKKNIPWNKINSFHMDEYVGLGLEAPQGFANFLKRKLMNDVTCREVHYLNGAA